jgi:hypothetical protein
LLKKQFLLTMRKLKLIWDFRGPEALKIAEHHEIHLKEYIIIQKLNVSITGYEPQSDLHAIAFMVVDESIMKPIRDALKPHRGQIYIEN